MSFIEINHIEKTFYSNAGDYKALQDITLHIEESDFITIVGGNGAGKSTFLNALAGSFDIDKGDIKINGTSITTLSEYERAKYISRVFQNALHGTAPRMTVCENMALAYRKDQKRRLKKGITPKEKSLFIEQLASLELGLETRLNTEMGLLSGGQRQAIALLMATLKKPSLLLLDEHTSALDPKMQQMVMKLTQQKIKENHMTALMITHNINDALTYGNRLIVLKNGQIIKDVKQEEKNKLTVTDIYALYD
ncbi:ATP-binding cassette domain-containing protein [Granulicatella sp. zg-ZJ]|uniref:ABC transporter ATP-binding protein n=1 Tax=Granulicatella sp. zg-ZJ TaxID=2678504 RepID=UPI0013D86909|nr:ATP-binding cassette domain-containing protein [Granulicatella sp. zg-ZJ]NEW62663.1 ATP-binding cassette domain-containing protein [Granulicatella sp. zg-ZJ]